MAKRNKKLKPLSPRVLCQHANAPRTDDRFAELEALVSNHTGTTGLLEFAYAIIAKYEPEALKESDHAD